LPIARCDAATGLKRFGFQTPNARETGAVTIHDDCFVESSEGAFDVSRIVMGRDDLFTAGPMIWIAIGVYASVLLLLSLYGFHRSYLLLVCARLRSRLSALRDGVPPIPLADLSDRVDLPRVTIQLPLYNEANVAVRLLEKVALIEYPPSRLEIQVLDDSTDETGQLLQPVIARLRARGLDVVYLHRTNRVGYKAGALDAGLAVAKGELVAMFDADFLPDADFLRRLVPHFQDPKVGMVQGRWGHLNRDESFFTRVGALMLDGHHVVENRVRQAAGWLFNFAGTGGMWRKSAIATSGGWQHDTLTEDLDLSLHGQNVVAPAEPRIGRARRGGTVGDVRSAVGKMPALPLGPVAVIAALGLIRGAGDAEPEALIQPLEHAVLRDRHRIEVGLGVGAAGAAREREGRRRHALEPGHERTHTAVL
jgi:hypothetical protein